MLAIAACGEFTTPAREYVRTREVELFFVLKSQIVDAFEQQGISIDYPDALGESAKLVIANQAESRLTKSARATIAKNLRHTAGEATFKSFASRIVGALTALPQEIRFIQCDETHPVRFTSLDAAEAFLNRPNFGSAGGATSYRYEVTYSDGFEFSRVVDSFDELRGLQHSLTEYVQHITNITTESAQ